MKFYRVFLFLLALDLALILPIALFLNPRFLIPSFVFLAIFNIWILFFFGYCLKRKLAFSRFSPEDPYGASRAFESLKARFNLKKARLLKAKGMGRAFFFFGDGLSLSAAVSEELLESLPEEDIKRLLAYPFQLAQSGDLLFLTALSHFALLAENILYFLNRPLAFFGKAPADKKESLALFFGLRLLAFAARRAFRRADKALSPTEEDKKKQALFLWRLDSLTSLNHQRAFAFMAPLFLTNPLTNSNRKNYVSLQPLIKKRVKALGGDYPP